MGTLRYGAQGCERGRVYEGMWTPAHVSNTPHTTSSDKGPRTQTHEVSPSLPTAGREAPALGSMSTSAQQTRKQELEVKPPIPPDDGGCWGISGPAHLSMQST